MSTISVVPVIRKQSQRKNGTYPVCVRVTYKCRHKLLTTNMVAERAQLSRSSAITDPALDEAVQTLVRRMRRAVNTIDPFALDCMEVEDVVAHIKKALSVPEGFALDFPDYFTKIASEKTKNARTNYMCALHSLQDFIGAEHFDISVVSSSMMHRYERFLRQKHGDGARALSLYTSAIAYVHRRARQEFNNEESAEVNIRNPFDYYKCPKQQPAQHRDVDRKVIAKMLSMRGELSGRERLGVDLFLISFALMGMNTPDIYSCAKPKDGVIIYNRTKTRDRRADRAEMHVRIEPCVKTLFSEYKDGGKMAFMFHNRYSTYQNLGRAANVGLDAFSKRIGVGKIDFYSARHSWATIASSLGIDKAVVNDCICHVDPSMRVTDIYIKKDWSVMWRANAKVLSKFKWPD